jgi:hypothetical protein
MGAEEGDLTGAIRESLPEGGAESVTVSLRCRWEDRQRLKRELLGGVVDDGNGNLTRQPPYQYPSNTRLYCLAIPELAGIKPMVGQDGWVFYKYAQMVAVFGAPAWQYTQNPPHGPNDASGEPWTVTELKASGEVVTPPEGTYWVGPFPSTTPASDANVGIILPSVEISMTRKWRTKCDLVDLEDILGTVNDSPIAVGTKTYDRGCVLFVSGEYHPAFDPLGTPAYDLQIAMLAKTHDWNMFLTRGGDAQFLNSAKTGDGEWPYPYAEFLPLP